MNFSQEELIALLSNNSYQIGDINSPLPLLYVEPVKPIHGQLNQEVTIDVRGYGFVPDMQVAIPGINVVEFRVVNFFHCKITVRIDYGTFAVTFYLDNEEVSTYQQTELVFNPSFVVDWIDYTTNIPSLLRSSYSTQVTDSLLAAKVTQTPLGLSSSDANNWVAFPEILLPTNSVFTYESICTFSNGSNAIRTGLAVSDNFNWTTPLRTISVANALENRSYSRVYKGRETYYESTDVVRGTNWLPSVIHTVIEFDRGEVHVEVFGRSSLNYNWSEPTGGEFIFEQYFAIESLEDTLTPIVWFMTANNSSYLVAQRVY